MRSRSYGCLPASSCSSRCSSCDVRRFAAVRFCRANQEGSREQPLRRSRGRRLEHRRAPRPLGARCATASRSGGARPLRAPPRRDPRRSRHGSRHARQRVPRLARSVGTPRAASCRRSSTRPRATTAMRSSGPHFPRNVRTASPARTARSSKGRSRSSRCASTTRSRSTAWRTLRTCRAARSSASRS